MCSPKASILLSRWRAVGLWQGAHALRSCVCGLLSPTLNQPVALAYVEPGSAAVGTTLQAMVRGKAVPMQVQATPFVAPRYHRG